MSQPVLSNYLIDVLLNCVYKATPFTGPATVYAALFTTEPMPAVTGTEVIGFSYARTAIATGAVSAHTLKNSSNLTFPTPTGSWGSPPWIALFDASSGGNMLTYAPLSVVALINAANPFQILTNNLNLSWF